MVSSGLFAVVKRLGIKMASRLMASVEIGEVTFSTTPFSLDLVLEGVQLTCW
jgi:hypothetical protein